MEVKLIVILLTDFPTWLVDLSNLSNYSEAFFNKRLRHTAARMVQYSCLTMADLKGHSVAAVFTMICRHNVSFETDFSLLDLHWLMLSFPDYVD